MKYCVYCGTALDDDMTACPHCGKEVIDSGQAANTKYCTKCGAAIHADAVICPKCGCSTGTTGSSVWGMLALIFGLMGGIIGLVLGIIGLPRSQTKTDRKMCIAGIVLSCIWLVVYIILVAMMVVLRINLPA